MSVMHSVDSEGRYDGLTLCEALPFVVDEVVAACHPVEVILFGSVARGEDGPDSDLDLLVVLDSVERLERRRVMRHIRSAIHTFVPIDLLVVDRHELESQRADVGSAVYWPLREGRVVYRRSDTNVA
jgi:uncharacterized protein